MFIESAKWGLLSSMLWLTLSIPAAAGECMSSPLLNLLPQSPVDDLVDKSKERTFEFYPC